MEPNHLVRSRIGIRAPQIVLNSRHKTLEVATHSLEPKNSSKSSCDVCSAVPAALLAARLPRVPGEQARVEECEGALRDSHGAEKEEGLPKKLVAGLAVPRGDST